MTIPHMCNHLHNMSSMEILRACIGTPRVCILMLFIKTMYNSSRSAVLLEGEKSSTFSVEQGVAQGCSLSPILFSVFISDLLEEIDKAEIGIQLKSGNKVGGLLLADDFVGITELSENLQQLIDIIYEFCSKWCLCANVNKSAVLVFEKDKVKGK